MVETLSSREELGEAVVARAAHVGKVPSEFRAVLARFAKAHRAFAKACDLVRRTTAPRDAAIGLLTKLDGQLDASVLKLVAKMVGAGMTNAASPLKGFSSYSPSVLVGMRFSDEAREVAKLVERVTSAAKDSGVKTALAEVRTRLAAANQALAAIEKPQAQLTSALRARDALLPEWDAALHSVKLHGRATWEDAPERLSALLAPVAPSLRGSKKRLTVRVPKKTRKAAAKSKLATPATPAP